MASERLFQYGGAVWAAGNDSLSSVPLRQRRDTIFLPEFYTFGGLIMWRNNILIGLMVFIALTMASLARADLISVKNASFESPATTEYTYGISDWSAAGPWSGVMLNNGVHGNVMANCDRDQFAFLPTWTLGWIWQDLSTTFEAGKTYTLTVGFGACANELPLKDQSLELRLFYRPAPGSDDAPSVASTTVAWNSLSNSSFTDFSATATVNAGDPCVGKTMGILLYAPSVGISADWWVDNVRLTVMPVPEPSIFLLLLPAGLALASHRKRWR
jgi:hypothetical protein